MPVPKDMFGEKVTRERERQGYTMRALSLRANVHHSEVSRIERGVRDPRLSTMARLSRALGVPLSDLVRGV